MRFGVLGPLTAEGAAGPLALRGPRHRAVLARLLVARRRVVPVRRLVDDLWDAPPEGAVGAVQTFVAALRRALEPERPARAPARLLVTQAPGYALLATPDSVDAWRFETAVSECGRLLAHGSVDAALARADEAIGLWRGPAYAEFGEYAWAGGEVARLDELRLLAVERRTEALVELGRAAEAVPELETHLDDHPWREDAWRLLGLALYRSGRQGDALGALRRARRALADDLGVDPGPGLRQLESDILAHAPHLRPRGTSTPAVVRAADRAAEDGPPLVGRAGELARLAEAATNAATRGRLRLALVSGEAGAGKTALAEAVTTRLAARGWTTAWGGNPDGAPAAWPWTRLLTTLAGAGHGPAPPPARPGAADPVLARFHWHRAVAGYLARVARHAPLLLVLDDLHRAGEETLALLTSVVADPVAEPVLVVATYRTTDVPGALTAFLGRVARAEPTRIHLGGLGPAEVPELVRATLGRDVDGDTARTIGQRSGGNPFFVRELARLLDSEGPGALSSVPPGVRDLVRHRVTTLPEPVRRVLRRAAVIGIEVDVDVLVALTGERPPVLDLLERAVARGFLVELAAGRFRFAHELIRDTLYHDLSRSRRARWHAAVAEAIERLRPGDVESLAQHYLLAGDPTTAEPAARHARAAAERAERRFAPHEAARLWEAALGAHDRAGDEDPRARLDLMTGWARALALTGALDRARRLRADALDVAESVGDPGLTARVIGAFDVPASWTEHDDPELAGRLAAVTERTLAALPRDATAHRSRLLSTLAMELRNTGGERARAAAREAETLARRVGDPALLAFALNARFLQAFERAGLAPHRARLGTDLVDVASRHGLVSFEVLGHLVLLQAHCALADFATADRHAGAADRLGEDHQLPLVGVLTQWYRALRSAVTGPPDEAEAAYRAAAIRLAGTGMTGLDSGLLPLALLCHRVQHGRPAGTDPRTDFGRYAPWCRPLQLLAAGDVARVGQVARGIPDSPGDLLLEARACLHAVVALHLGDRPTMERRYADLRPAADELAGAGSGLLTLRPVAHHLGDLAATLGRRRAAAEHYRHAVDVATRAGAPHWIRAARAALDRVAAHE
ncbi:BTAD domain-containing putative transcriptional regulator [Amycolatopsis arida]|uniref:BTAD domain-containing putative transcriptional regulator n=1 Tax=Amycolatopsis arida TaxID=587909 RepID=UPI000B8652F3|nr:BTAD domain-containing putative transcriptional regulator [Amycolatopsis arida]